MLTARGEEADRIVGLELGADDYVTKPFSPRELAARVRTVLRRTVPPTQTAQRLAFGDVVIDGSTREVTKARQRMRLTAKEFDLLWFLASHPRQRLLARPADGPRVGLRGGGRHGHRHRPRPPAAREDRGPPVAAAHLQTRLGRRLQARAVIGTRRSGVAAADPRRRARRSRSGCRLLPTRPRPARRPRRSGRLRCRSRPSFLSGWVMFHMGDDVKILAVAVAAASAARRRRAAPRPRSPGRSGGSRVSPPDRRRRLRVRAPRGRTGRARRARPVVQRDGRRARAGLRRAPRARRLGEPRPAHADRIDAGDARGARGRPGRARPTTSPRSGSRCARSPCSSTTSSSSPGSTPAR